MKLGIFSEAFDVGGLDRETMFSRVGSNTGNLVFFRAIKKLFNPDFLKPYYGINNIEEKISEYDAFLTTDLIWIRENAQYENTEQILKNIGHRPLIPVSVGLQSNDFKSDFCIHPKTIRLLYEIAERCVVGVRGEYTADILDKYGIRNLKVIGCPSVYYKDKYNLTKLSTRTQIETVCSFKTFWGRCSEKEIKFLDYCRKRNLDFIEQTAQPMSTMFIRDCVRFEEWLADASHIFFDIDEWDRFMQNYDFYIGMRFHGGIIAMQNNVCPLFIITDSRVRELTEFFGLPSIDVKKFNTLTPLKKYYAKTDYTEFYERYEQHKETMKEFAKKNNLEINLQ